VTSPKCLKTSRGRGIFPPPSPEIPRDPLLIWIETKVRQAIRDSVNQHTRKPFVWGGLRGYEQLEAIAQGLDQIQGTNPQNNYLHWLQTRVAKVLARNRNAADDMERAHYLLSQIAACLHYPPPKLGSQLDQKIDRQRVSQEITTLIQETKPDGKITRAQSRLLKALKKRWESFGEELLFCYDIPGLPQDNLKLESLFGHMRCHQRRISGHKSTRELQDFGQVQLFFTASSHQELLEQIQVIPHEDYLFHRSRLAEAELPRQFIQRLHHDPETTISTLIHYHKGCCQNLIKLKTTAFPSEQVLHTP
jgi:hypothetical protein